MPFLMEQLFTVPATMLVILTEVKSAGGCLMGARKDNVCVIHAPKYTTKVDNVK